MKTYKVTDLTSIAGLGRNGAHTAIISTDDREDFLAHVDGLFRRHYTGNTADLVFTPIEGAAEGADLPHEHDYKEDSWSCRL